MWLALLLGAQLTRSGARCRLQGSAVAFQLHLDSGAKVQAHIYLCYDRQPSDNCDDVPVRGPAPVAGSDHFAW